MLYLVPVPIIIIAATVLMVAKTYKLKLIGKLSKVIIAVGVVFFIHFFTQNILKCGPSCCIITKIL